MKLIDKAALVAEIERLRKELQDKVETSDFIAGEVFIMNYFLSFLDTLEVREVDLDKEIDLVEDKYRGFESLSRADIIDIAKYFFKFGLKARKGE